MNKVILPQIITYKVSHKSEYTPHISAKQLYNFSKGNIAQMKLGYILD